MRILSAAVALCLILLAPVLQASSAEGGGETNSRGYDYIEFKPGLVVNFGATGRVGFLKADVSLKVASAAKAHVEEHMPAIRHQLIMLLSRQDEAGIAAGAPREALRLEALEAVRTLMQESAGVEPEEIQDLLFTGFITQR